MQASLKLSLDEHLEPFYYCLDRQLYHNLWFIRGDTPTRKIYLYWTPFCVFQLVLIAPGPPRDPFDPVSHILWPLLHNLVRQFTLICTGPLATSQFCVAPGMILQYTIPLCWGQAHHSTYYKRSPSIRPSTTYRWSLTPMVPQLTAPPAHQETDKGVLT